jgi:hypothetical protein
MDERSKGLDESMRRRWHFRRRSGWLRIYANPHWQLGNFYLRQNRGDEAFVELRRTTDSNQIYRNQVFTLAWDYFGHRPEMVEQLVVDTSVARSDLASFFALRKEPVAALRVWNSLSETEKAQYPQTAKFISQALYELRAFREALEFSRQAGVDPTAAAEAITNGGFESPLKMWKTPFSDGRSRGETARSKSRQTSPFKHSGSKGLRITFRSFSKPELYHVWQKCRGCRRHQIHIKLLGRTENLKTGGLL